MSYPSGTFVPEAVTASLSFLKSDKMVYTTVSTRPVDPCQPTSAMLGPIVSYIRNPNPTFPGRLHDFYGCLYAGLGTHMGYSQISVTWTRLDRRLHINCLELKVVIAALRHWASVLRGYQVLIATDNTIVVFYINKHGGTHLLTLLRLVVDLFMWLQAQDIVLIARYIPCCLYVTTDCLSRPNQPRSTEWSLHSEIVIRIFQFWELQQWTCLPQSTIPAYLSSCLQFQSL